MTSALTRSASRSAATKLRSFSWRAPSVVTRRSLARHQPEKTGWPAGAAVLTLRTWISRSRQPSARTVVSRSTPSAIGRMSTSIESSRRALTASDPEAPRHKRREPQLESTHPIRSSLSFSSTWIKPAPPWHPFANSATSSSVWHCRPPDRIRAAGTAFPATSSQNRSASSGAVGGVRVG